MAARTRAVRLSDAALLALAARYAKAKRIIKRLDHLARDLQARMLAEMARRGARTLRLGDTTITVVRGEAVSYDEAGLLAALRPSVRSGVSRSEVVLDALPTPVRERLVATLSAAERRAATRHVLDVPALEGALAAGRIREDEVAPYRTVKARAPYITITDAPA